MSPPQESPEDWTINDGAEEVAKRLSGELDTAVCCNAPVSKREQHAAGLNVICGDCQTLQARAAVVAIPPAFRLKID